MDPITRMWMFNNWLEDTNENVELFKHHGYLIGSFFNPEAVKSLTGGGNSYSTSDEEFEQTSKMVSDAIQKEREMQATAKVRKRRRKKTLKE
jgi:hypothetical protein